MAEKRKSIIEEALLDAKSLEDALKANTKEMLSAHMSKEIESIVESSLIEQDEEPLEEDDIEIQGSADDMEDVEINLDNELPDDSEEESGELEVMDLPDDGEEMADVELDLDADLDLDGGEGDEELELDLEPMGMELGMGDDVLDMTMASDDEVVTVFKKLGPDDEVEVVKDADGIHLTDNETGAEYYIKESLEELDGMTEGCDESLEEDCEPLEEETIYEIEMDNDDEVLGEQDPEEGDEEPMEEAKYKYSQKGGRSQKRGGKVGSEQASPYGSFKESRKTRKPVVRRKPKTDTVSESKIMKEYKELKSKNNEYKKALNVFKDKLNEVALFNTNLAYVNRLFTEHSTTKKEKMEILKRFDSAESVKESKSTYKTIKSELDRKAPISESVENKVNKTVKSSKSDLNESTAYVDPQIVAIKDLMKRIS